MKARSGIPVGMVPIRDENGDVRLISFEEYRQWLRVDPSEKGQHPINNPAWGTSSSSGGPPPTAQVVSLAATSSEDEEVPPPGDADEEEDDAGGVEES